MKSTQAIRAKASRGCLSGKTRTLLLAALQPPKEPVRRNPDSFEALDPVMTRWVDVKGTLADVTALYDSDTIGEATAETMVRHIARDIERMDAACAAARERLVVAKVDA